MFKLRPTSARLRAISTAFKVPFALLVLVSVGALNLHGAESSRSDLRRTPAAVFDCNPGPWGNLEYVKISLEPPDYYAQESLSYVKATRWFFKGYDQQQLTAYFQSLGLKTVELSALLEKSRWQQATNGIWVAPDESLVLKLNQEVRIKLYTILSGYEENVFYRTPFVFRPEALTDRFSRSGLSEKTAAAVKSLLYPRGTLIAFSDVAAVMSQIQDQQEKIHLIKVLSRKSTLMLRLKLTENSDVSRLLDYWGVGGRSKDLKPLLESLTRVDGGWEVDVAHLLPPFARKYLYTFPSPARSQAKPNDNCHWTSFNFFNEPSDDAFHDARRVEKAINEEYDVVTGSKHLGDVLLVMDSGDSILHSAVYIADDIVFTKTGGRENQPWILMKTDDMLPLYASANQPLKVVICRKKALDASAVQ